MSLKRRAITVGQPPLNTVDVRLSIAEAEQVPLEMPDNPIPETAKEKCIREWEEWCQSGQIGEPPPGPGLLYPELADECNRGPGRPAKLGAPNPQSNGRLPKGPVWRIGQHMPPANPQSAQQGPSNSRTDLNSQAPDDQTMVAKYCEFCQGVYSNPRDDHVASAMHGSFVNNLMPMPWVPEPSSHFFSESDDDIVFTIGYERYNKIKNCLRCFTNLTKATKWLDREVKGPNPDEEEDENGGLNQEISISVDPSKSKAPNSAAPNSTVLGSTAPKPGQLTTAASAALANEPTTYSLLWILHRMEQARDSENARKAMVKSGRLGHVRGAFLTLPLLPKIEQ